MSTRDYNRSWMKSKRQKLQEAELVSQGKCPKCGVILALSTPDHDCTKYDWKILDE